MLHKRLKPQLSELRGGTACPGAPSVCPGNSNPNTELSASGKCRCKIGFRESGSGTGSDLVCEACASDTWSDPTITGSTICRQCYPNTVATPDRSGCQCMGGWVPLGFNIVKRVLTCTMCPEGYYSAAGDVVCSPCRGYYSYSSTGSGSCSVCPPDSYANAQHTGCQCNKDCGPGSGSGASLVCSCAANNCRFLSNGLEGTGNVCQCKAGYLQQGSFDMGSAMTCTASTTLEFGCEGDKEYTLAGDTTCRTCPANSPPLANKDGCMCNGGYAPAPGTSSQNGALQCSPCRAGTFAAAGDLQCTSCAELRIYSPSPNQVSTGYYSGATAAACVACPILAYNGYCQNSSSGPLSCAWTVQPNADNTDCDCVIVRTGSDYDGACTKSNSGALTTCSCTFSPKPAAGRRLHSTAEDSTGQSSFALQESDLESLVSTSTLQAGAEEPHTINSNNSDTVELQLDKEPVHLTPTSVSPMLNINGKPATVLPMEVVRTTWEGHDATDVAACLAGALLTMRNLSLLAPPAMLAGLGLHKTAAASLAGGLLPQLWPGHGSATVFTSSMYKSGPKLSARELRGALVKHYASLLVLPCCLSVPDAAAHRMHVALSNVVSMTTSTAGRRGGELADIIDSFTHTAELSVDVEKVVNKKYPELCGGIEGSSFRLRFAGFGGLSSLSAASPNHIWIYAAVAEEAGLCDQPSAAV